MASLEENTDTSPESADGDPLAAAMKSENAGIVAAALAELPEHQRLVVTLRIWGGLSYAEIAASADRTEATVRSHMFRALESLRKSLAPALVQD